MPPRLAANVGQDVRGVNRGRPSPARQGLTALARAGALGLRNILQHDGPAQDAEQVVDLDRSTAVCPAAIGTRRRPRRAAPLADPLIEKHPHALVPLKGLAHVLVELQTVPGHDEKLSGCRPTVGGKLGRIRALAQASGGFEESRQGHPDTAPTGGAGRGPDLEAHLTIDTEHQTAERQVRKPQRTSRPGEHGIFLGEHGAPEQCEHSAKSEEGAFSQLRSAVKAGRRVREAKSE